MRRSVPGHHLHRKGAPCTKVVVHQTHAPCMQQKSDTGWCVSVTLSTSVSSAVSQLLQQSSRKICCLIVRGKQCALPCRITTDIQQDSLHKLLNVHSWRFCFLFKVVFRQILQTPCARSIVHVFSTGAIRCIAAATAVALSGTAGVLLGSV